MTFLTAEEIAQQLRCSVWFVYQNRRIFGGIKIGKLVRFDKEIFESKLKEVMQNVSLPPSGEMEVRLLEGECSTSGGRIPDEAGSKGSRGGCAKKSKTDEFGLHRLMREQVKRP